MAEILPIRRKTLSNQSINQHLPSHLSKTHSLGRNLYLKMYNEIHVSLYRQRQKRENKEC